MFVCKICGETFTSDEMSEEHNICNDCYDEENIRELLAIEII